MNEKGNYSYTKLTNW